MDEKSTSLARLGLQVFSKEMSPEYMEVRRRLLGYLAAQGSTVEQLTKKDQDERANVEMLSRFTKKLPRATLAESGWQFATADPYAVRLIQSHVIWHGETFNSETGRMNGRPYFVLGRSGQKQDTRLLLACAGENSTAKPTNIKESYGGLFFYSKPGNGDRKRLQALQAIEASDYPDPDTMEQLFDRDRHLLIVDWRSPGSTIMQGYPDDLALPMTHISGADLGTMDVHSQMDKIATKFGIEAELDQILAQHEIPDLRAAN